MPHRRSLSCILLVEDNPGDARLLRELLREVEGPPLDVVHVTTLGAVGEALAAAPVDVVLLDLSLPDTHGLETVTRMRELAPELAVVVLTGLDDESVALEAVQAGAQDYLVKGTLDGRLVWRALRYAVERQHAVLERARLLDAEREAREIAQRASRARDEVLGVVSHDLRNPLSTIAMCAESLLDDSGRTPERTDELLRTIRQATDWMGTIIRDLLDVTAIEAGRLAVRCEPLRPDDVLLAAYEMFGPQADAAELRLMLHGEPELPTISGDRERLLQVLGNLVGNALKFTPAGGRITIGARRSATGADGVETGIAFWVADTGCGMAAEHLPHVFDRFWQVGQTRRAGAGLGLAIARGIVQAHGGELRVESRLGEGTTFTFTIP